MQRRFSIRSALIAFLCLPGVSIAAPEEENSLLVMLQGVDQKTLQDTVTRHGGTVSHKLPIIEAVGAVLSQAQLDAVLTDSPEIQRVIDDLAWEPDPEQATPQECALAGSLELHWEGPIARWELFNKDTEPLALKSLDLTWPASLGTLRSVQLGDKNLKVSDAVPGESLHVSLEDSVALSPASKQALKLRFSDAPDNAYAVQNQIALTASAGEECDTKLVSSYLHPKGDSYYPSVSGAALLHSHGITGAGTTVAVLDSGLWEGNPELVLDTKGSNRVRARYDAIQGKAVDEAFDESGHGTHMTSVLARSGSTSSSGAPKPSYRGIAPDAGVVVVKAFGESGEAGFLDLVRGVQWVVDNREKLDIRVLNLSFASRPRWPYWEDPVNQALMRAWEAGIFIVAAGGNEGPEPMTIGSPGNLPYLLTVGAITDSWTESDRNDDYIPDFSSRGPTPLGHIKPDIVAPGGHMAGIVRPGSTLARQSPEFFLSTGEFVMTGTSQAAALVSGLAALMLQLEPELSNDDLKCMLRTSAMPAIDADGRLAYSPFAQGEGLVSLQRALTLGRTDCEQGALDLAADLSGESHYQGPAVFAEEASPSLPGADLLISTHAAEKGFSERRRWGVSDHLDRLETAPHPFPIDWQAIFLEEQRRIKNLASGNSP